MTLFTSPKGIQKIKRFFPDRLMHWVADAHISRRIFIFLGALITFMGLVTFGLFFSSKSLGMTPNIALFILNADLIILFISFLFLGLRLFYLWSLRRRGKAGSRLHVNLVLILSFLTLTPTVLITTLFSLFFNIGVHGWFSDRVETALRESNAIAKAYYSEHQKVIAETVRSMAMIISQQKESFLEDRSFFNEVLDINATIRHLNEAIVFDANQMLARTRFSFALQFEHIPPEILEKASKEVVFLKSTAKDRVRAVIQIPETSLYLLVGRLVDAKVLKRIDQVHQAVDQYEQIGKNLDRLNRAFGYLFFMICMVLLLMAMLLGYRFATKLTLPIRKLIQASEKVRHGNLHVRVPERQAEDDLGLLSKTFNRMVEQLFEQKNRLIGINQEMDRRRQFIESVLAGVRAGVISCDNEGMITLMNDSAKNILYPLKGLMVGQPLTQVHPHFATLFQDIACDEAKTQPPQQISFTLMGQTKTLILQCVSTEKGGFIVTFDDITSLLKAEKKAAWSDVARRIAHEIKNPLTPIQLSAERLKRKYTPHIVHEPEKFSRALDTILRQVQTIGHLISEFSAFARMPTPKKNPEAFVPYLKDCLDFQSQARPDISFSVDIRIPEDTTFSFDGGQMSQVINNVIKNAFEAIDERKNPQNPGKIMVTLDFDKNMLSKTVSSESPQTLILSIQDNGDGFNQDHLDILTEPYRTFRPKGTGLGLSIVRKIIEDHGGTLFLKNTHHGACVEIQLPLA